MNGLDTHIGDLIKAVSYDPETGIFRWVIPQRRSIKAGDIISSVCPTSGYPVVWFRGTRFLLHRVAFYVIHGRWPVMTDHINGIKTDNKLTNLRECDGFQNKQNLRMSSNNTSGYPGVFWNRGKWQAGIMHQRRQIYLGRFDDPTQAYAAYRSAKAQYHTFSPNGVNLPPIPQAASTACTE